MKVDFANEIYNKYRENKLSHAYLIETNNLDETYNKVLELCKKLECENTYQDSCSKCNICNLISNENLPNIKKITPEGTVIRKEQILTLMENFSTMPVYSKYNIYIIYGCEKLNEYSSNALLKFLEEPEDNIIGFLLTDNKDKVLSTITSRCQCYQNNYELDKEIYETEIINLANQYYDLINNNVDSLLLVSKASSLILKDKNSAKSFFELLLNKYIDNFNKNNSNIIKIIQKNIEKLQFNVNIELLIDAFVIEMSEING